MQAICGHCGEAMIRGESPLSESKVVFIVSSGHSDILEPDQGSVTGVHREPAYWREAARFMAGCVPVVVGFEFLHRRGRPHSVDARRTPWNRISYEGGLPPCHRPVLSTTFRTANSSTRSMRACSAAGNPVLADNPSVTRAPLSGCGRYDPVYAQQGAELPCAAFFLLIVGLSLAFAPAPIPSRNRGCETNLKKMQGTWSVSYHRRSDGRS